MSHTCIWCSGIAKGRHIEHIIPQALGCPTNFVLTGTTVCLKCNNGLAHLDRAVSDEFDFLTFLAGVPRKKGRPPVISSRGNVHGSHKSNNPTITFNMERHAMVAHDGSRVAAYGGSDRNVNAQFNKIDEKKAQVSFSITLGNNPKFVRGLTKIAFSTAAYFLGAESIRGEAFEPVRQFVLNGIGNRHVMITESADPTFRNQAWPPYRHSSGGLVVTFRLAQAEFLIDLTPDEGLLPIFEAKQMDINGTSGWCVSPMRG